jgi:hypothetical protein
VFLKNPFNHIAVNQYHSLAIAKPYVERAGYHIRFCNRNARNSIKRRYCHNWLLLSKNTHTSK